MESKSTGNKRGKTPFHVDAKSIDNNISSDMYGVTHFHIAAELGHFEICQLITENIEVKNPTTMKGWTPLHLATLNGHFDIC